MIAPVVTSLYAALAGLMLVVLTVRIIAVRRQLRVSAGDGGNEDLARRVRAHGNFIEFVPLALILMALTEMTGASVIVVHVLGVVLIAGRIAHAVSMATGSMAARFVGVSATLLVLIGGSLACLAAFIRATG
jgi:hypothetical protein